MADSVRIVNFRDYIWPGKKELAYDDAIGDGEAGVARYLVRAAPTMPTPDRRTDADMQGKDHDFMGDLRSNLGWDIRLRRDVPLDSLRAGWLLGLAMGSVSSASGGSGDHTHTIKHAAVATNKQLPSTTIVEDQTDEASGFQRKISGLVVESLEISALLGEWANVSFEMLGSGTVDDAASVSAPALTTSSPFKFSAINVATWGDVSSAADGKARLRGFRFGLGNGHLAGDGYTAGATVQQDGPVRSKCEFGARAISASIDFLASTTSKSEVEDLLSDSDQEATVKLRGTLIGGAAYNECQIHLPLANFTAVSPSDVGGVKVYSAEYDVRYNTGDAAPVVATVTNTLSQLLQAAA